MNYRKLEGGTHYYDVEIGDIFMAADGGSYGYLVMGFHENGTDVIARAFNKKGFEDENRTIDGFKITYRYYKPKWHNEEIPNWVKFIVAKECLK